MVYQQVFQKFRELASIDDNEAEKYRWLCNECVDELNEMLADNGKVLSENRFSSVAASMVWYRYTTVATDGGLTDFKAGEISIKYTPKTEAAKIYMENCLKSIAPYLKDRQFVFRRVNSIDISDGI